MNYILEKQETERLKFRLVEMNDFDVWLGLFKAENVARFLGLDPCLTPHELCTRWFTKVFHRYENDLGGMNALIDKKTNQFIGQCGLLVQTIENKQRLEIGYSVLPQFWNKGYAYEAANKCKCYAFENNFSDSLISMVHVDNIASEKVARKNGMTLEKRLDEYKGNPVNIFRVDRGEF